MWAVEQVRDNNELIQFIVSFLKSYKEAKNIKCCCHQWRNQDVLNPLHPSLKKFYEIIRAPFSKSFSTTSIKSMTSPSLQVLEIPGAAHVNDQGLYYIGQGCPNLKFLSISRCYGITDQGLAYIGRSCPQLRHIDVTMIPQLSDTGMGYLVTHCKAIEWIGFSHNPLIGDSVIRDIAECCQKISVIHANSTAVTAYCMPMISRQCKHLTELSLNQCHHLSDNEIGMLSTNCFELEVVEVADCPDITNLGLRLMHLNLIKLRKVDVSGCTVSGEGIQQLLASGIAVEHEYAHTQAMGNL